MKLFILIVLIAIFGFENTFSQVVCSDTNAKADKSGVCYCNYSYFGTPSGINTSCTSCGGNQSSPYGSISSSACITCPSATTKYDEPSGQCLCIDANATFNYTADTCICKANYFGDPNRNTCTQCPDGQTSKPGTVDKCEGSNSIILMTTQFILCLFMLLF